MKNEKKGFRGLTLSSKSDSSMARRSSSLWGWGHWEGKRREVGMVFVDHGY